MGPKLCYAKTKMLQVRSDNFVSLLFFLSIMPVEAFPISFID